MKNNIENLFIDVASKVSDQEGMLNKGNHMLTSIIIWLIPIIGGFYYLNDNNEQISKSAQRSLCFSTMMLLLCNIMQIISPILTLLIAVIWLAIALYFMVLFQNHKSSNFAIVDDIVKYVFRKKM